MVFALGVGLPRADAPSVHYIMVLATLGLQFIDISDFHDEDGVRGVIDILVLILFAVLGRSHKHLGESIACVVGAV